MLKNFLVKRMKLVQLSVGVKVMRMMIGRGCYGKGAPLKLAMVLMISHSGRAGLMVVLNLRTDVFPFRWEKLQLQKEAVLGRGKRQRKIVSYNEGIALKSPLPTSSEVGCDVLHQLL